MCCEHISFSPKRGLVAGPPALTQWPDIPNVETKSQGEIHNELNQAYTTSYDSLR